MTLKRYDCYLFDLDGTLIDTVDLICECYKRFSREVLGREIPREQVLPLIGIPLKTQFRNFFPPLSDAEFEALVEKFMAYQYEIYPRFLKIFPGVQRSLACLHARGARLGIVTSRRRYSAEMYTREVGILGWFDVLVTPEDTPKHKPDPDPVLKAMQAIGADPSATIVVGDSEYDILSGAAAGTETAFAAWGAGGPVPKGFRPTWVIASMAELCDEPAPERDGG